MPEPLDILYRDDRLIAVNKPAGMLVHRSRSDRTASVFVLQTLRNQIDRRVYPVHRLDKPTSGILLFTMDSEAATAVSDQFENRSVEKVYLTVVRGWTDDEETIDYPLRKSYDKTTDSQASSERNAQEAVTEYQTLAVGELDRPVGRYDTARYSLVEARPRTGRQHQLRRHFKHIFHPIIGDRKYGDRDHNAFWKESIGIDQLLLHASEISLRSPGAENDVHISAPVPAHFHRALEQLGWSDRAG